MENETSDILVPFVCWGFLDTEKERYNIYRELADKNLLKFENISLIAELLKLYGADRNTNPDIYDSENIDRKLETFLLKMFVNMNSGSLTASVKKNEIDFKKYEGLFSFYKENEKFNPDREKSLFAVFENEAGDPLFAGFHSYVSAALFLREDLKKRLEANEISYRNCVPDDIKKALETTEKKSKEMKMCDEQTAACALALMNRFTVINGGPGTGKTTVVFNIIKALFEYDSVLEPDKIVLLASTGKASAGLKDSIKKKCISYTDSDAVSKKIRDLQHIKNMTVHKFRENARLKEMKVKKDCRLVIVDEVSMIDIYLMATLMNCISEDTRLILVGDYNQLPSVDAGTVMADLSDGAENPLAESIIKNVCGDIYDNISVKPRSYLATLKENHRSEKELNRVFREIEEEKPLSLEKTEDFQYHKKIPFIIEKSSDNRKNLELCDRYFSHAYLEPDEALGMSYTEKVNEISGRLDYKNSSFDEVRKELDLIFEHIKKYKILCGVRKGVCGCSFLNERFLKKYRSAIGSANIGRYPNGCILMVTKNNNRIGIFNGDTGIVLKDRNNCYKLIFKVKEEYRSFLVYEFENTDYSFAMTVHKSQGAEYDNVLIPMYEINKDFYTKKLFYTAVTRAKKTFTVIGDRKTADLVCKNNPVRENHLKLV